MKRFITLSFCFALCVPNFLAGIEAAPQGKPAQDFHPPKRVDYSLANGMQVTLVPFGRVPKVQLELVIATGKIDDGENTGLGDLTLESLTEGTTSRDQATIAREVAEMGGSIDKQFGFDEASISTEVLREFGPMATALIADIVQHPAFHEANVAQSKQSAIRDNSVNRASAQFLAMDAFAKQMFPNHPYGRLLPTEAQIESYEVAAVKNFHAENFGALRAHLYIVGQFDEKAIRAAVEASFGTWKKGKPATIMPPTAAAKSELVFIDRPNSPQATLRLGQMALPLQSPEQFTQNVANSILGGSFSSRITSNIREQKGYTYSPSSQLSSRRNLVYWAEGADITIASTGPAVQEILKEIELMRTTPVENEELSNAKNYMCGLFLIRNGSRNGVINMLRYSDFNQLGKDYSENYIKKVQAVSAAEIQAYCSKVLDPAKMAMVLVGDKTKTVPQIKELPLFKAKVSE